MMKEIREGFATTDDVPSIPGAFHVDEPAATVIHRLFEVSVNITESHSVRYRRRRNSCPDLITDVINDASREEYMHGDQWSSSTNFQRQQQSVANNYAFPPVATTMENKHATAFGQTRNLWNEEYLASLSPSSSCGSDMVENSGSMTHQEKEEKEIKSFNSLLHHIRTIKEVFPSADEERVSNYLRQGKPPKTILNELAEESSSSSASVTRIIDDNGDEQQVETLHFGTVPKVDTELEELHFMSTQKVTSHHYCPSSSPLYDSNGDKNHNYLSSIRSPTEHHHHNRPINNHILHLPQRSLEQQQDTPISRDC